MFVPISIHLEGSKRPSFRRYFAAANRCPSHLDPADHDLRGAALFSEYVSLHFAASRTSSHVFSRIRDCQVQSSKNSTGNHQNPSSFSTKRCVNVPLGTSGARLRLGRQHCRAAVASAGIFFQNMSRYVQKWQSEYSYTSYRRIQKVFSTMGLVLLSRNGLEFAQVPTLFGEVSVGVIGVLSGA